MFPVPQPSFLAWEGLPHSSGLEDPVGSHLILRFHYKLFFLFFIVVEYNTYSNHYLKYIFY